MYGAPLEAQRETRSEVADLWRGQEVGRAAVRLRGRVDLGIEAAVVGPGVQVAAGEGEDGRPRAGAPRVALGQRERQRDLAQLRERCVLDVPAEVPVRRRLRSSLLLEVPRVRQLHGRAGREDR